MKVYSDVSVHNLTAKEPYENAVKKAVQYALIYAGVKGRNEVSVVMMGERDIRALEKEWKGEDKVTDVLSFRFAEGGGVKILASKNAIENLGEIVICLPYAYRYAKEIGVSAQEHIITLAAHGAVHLAGIDHEQSEKEQQRTDAIQKKVKKHFT